MFFFYFLMDVFFGKKLLDWNMCVSMVVGVVEGFFYLYNVVDLFVIYCDMKVVNILLGEDFSLSLFDFGFVKVGFVGDSIYVFMSVMGIYGYCVFDYVVSGKFIMKFDMYSFGVFLLELIMGSSIYDVLSFKLE